MSKESALQAMLKVVETALRYELEHIEDGTVVAIINKLDVLILFGALYAVRRTSPVYQHNTGIKKAVDRFIQQVEFACNDVPSWLAAMSTGDLTYRQFMEQISETDAQRVTQTLVSIEFSYLEIYSLVSIVQYMVRHKELSEHTKEVLMHVFGGLEEQLSRYPLIYCTLHLGWDPDYDQTEENNKNGHQGTTNGKH